MPLLAHNALPAFARLAAAGVPVLAADAWDGPALRVGLVNTMADAALEATERQFLRLLAAGAPERGVRVIPCGLPDIPRSDSARQHCDAHYATFAQLRAQEPHALVVTGANIPDPDLDRLFYRDALAEVIAWADAAVPTTLFSCLATHAVLHFRYGRRRRALPRKRWGVFPHRVAAPGHPLVRSLPERLAIPHSRWNEVPAADFAAAGLDVLVVDDEDGGVHLAATPDGRGVFLQGHPEYEPISLVKEHKREAAAYAAGRRADYPETPRGLADAGGEALLATHRAAAEAARRDGAPPPPYPEEALHPHLHHRWHDDTVRFFANWLDAAAPR